MKARFLLLTILAFANFTVALAAVEPPLNPPINGGPVEVRVNFHLENVSEIDDEAETFRFTGVLSLTWRDERQSFDPVKAGVPEKIYQGSYQIDEISPAWYPQVVLRNESGEYEKTGSILRVAQDGTSTLTETVSAVASANFNMRRYPFDHQRLFARFVILGFDRNHVRFELPAGDKVSAEPILISQWELGGIRIVPDDMSGPYSALAGVSSAFAIALDVQRQSLFMMRLVILPLMLIVMLSWSVFWMDRSSLGDRINVSFVGILTGVAYQIVVADILPHISYITLMNGFLNVSFLCMCASVVVNLRVGALDRQGRSVEGDLLDDRCRRLFPAAYFGLVVITVLVFFWLS